jgi:hypothetical protein
MSLTDEDKRWFGGQIERIEARFERVAARIERVDLAAHRVSQMGKPR